MYFLLALAIAFPSAFAAVIEVPADIRDPGSIKLEGTPGANQKDDFEICYLSRDKDGRLASNGMARCSKHKLGEDVHAKAGTYLVKYEGMSTVAEVKDQQVPLKLIPLELTKINGTYSFSLYRDLENSEENKSQLAVEIFVGEQSNLRPSLDRCGKDYKLDNEGKNHCSRLSAVKAPADLLQFLKFGPSGSVYFKGVYNTEKVVGDDYLYSAKFNEKPDAYLRVAVGKDGDFVSVLPGVYSAYFWSATYHSTTQPNIIVK